MSTLFNPNDKLIGVKVRLFGPTGDYYAHLALDTGASFTVIRTALLVSTQLAIPLHLISATEKAQNRSSHS